MLTILDVLEEGRPVGDRDRCINAVGLERRLDEFNGLNTVGILAVG